MKSFKQYIKETPYYNDIGPEEKSDTPLQDLPSQASKRNRLNRLGDGIIKHRAYLNGTHAEYTVHHKDDNTIRMYTAGEQQKGSNKYFEKDLGSTRGSPVKAHELYTHLILNHGLHMHSDDSLSKGAIKVWQKLRENPNIHFQLYNAANGTYHPDNGMPLEHHMNTQHMLFSAKKKTLSEAPEINDIEKENLEPYDSPLEDKKNMRKISDLKGHDIKKLHYNRDKWALYTAHNKDDKVSLQVYGPQEKDSKDFFESQLNGYGNKGIKAHEFYHHLITNHGLKIHSDTTHSIGAKKTWEELHRNKDIKMQSYDDRSKQYVDISKGTSLEPYYRSHIRLVASKNDKI